MPIKNLWSLNVDELLVADKLKQNFNKKKYEVFFPVNSQMKDIDLLLVDLKKYKPVSIQVKGSRTWDIGKTAIEKYGNGSAAWFRITKGSVFTPRNWVDFFVFVLHSFADSKTRKEIKVDYLIVPINHLKNILKKKIKGKGNVYNFYIFIDEKSKRSLEFRDGKSINLSKYLNNWNRLK